MHLRCVFMCGEKTEDKQEFSPYFAVAAATPPARPTAPAAAATIATVLAVNFSLLNLELFLFL